MVPILIILLTGLVACVLLGFAAVYWFEDWLLPRLVVGIFSLEVGLGLRLVLYVIRDLGIRALQLTWGRQPLRPVPKFRNLCAPEGGRFERELLCTWLRLLRDADTTEHNLRSLLKSSAANKPLYLRELCHTLRTQSLYLRRCRCTAYAHYKITASALGRRRALIGTKA
jgi:hypothetical protein